MCDVSKSKEYNSTGKTRPPERRLEFEVSDAAPLSSAAGVWGLRLLLKSSSSLAFEKSEHK